LNVLNILKQKHNPYLYLTHPAPFKGFAVYYHELCLERLVYLGQKRLVWLWNQIWSYRLNNKGRL